MKPPDGVTCCDEGVASFEGDGYLPASEAWRHSGARGSNRQMEESGISLCLASVVMLAVWSSKSARGEDEEPEEERASRRESRDADDREVKCTVPPGPTRDSMWRYCM